MTGKTICVLSDSCATPVSSGINKFRGDFEALIKKKAHVLVPAAVA
jgi:NADH-quinone oxidoreductase subunit F